MNNVEWVFLDFVSEKSRDEIIEFYKVEKQIALACGGYVKN